MVLIPGGRFMMGAVRGDDRAEPDESPPHLVSVPTFYIDRTEVTRAQFRKFVEATRYVTDLERSGKGTTFGAPPHQDWIRNQTWQSVPPGVDQGAPWVDELPVSFITFKDAEAYCKWVGARLPTEAEFEYLLRTGEKGTSVYPWGSEGKPPHEYGNFCGTEMVNAYPAWKLRIVTGYRDSYLRAAPVRRFRPDANGLFDVSGNVSEWCSDPFIPYGSSYEDHWLPSAIPSRVMRGGNFFSPPSELRCSWRREANPDTGREWWGFRCARTTAPE